MWATKLDDVDETEDEAVDPKQSAKARAETQRLIVALVQEVERAWTLAPAAQKTAAPSLAARVAEMGIRLAAMPIGSIANVRLARLLLRHHEALDDDAWSMARSMLAFADLSHPEVVELLLDVVRAESWDTSFALELGLGEEFDVDALPTAAPLLTAIVRDEAAPFGRRAIAARWLRGTRSPAATEALRAALRLASFSLRSESLLTLGDSIDEDSTLFLLEDVVIHPPVRDDDEELLHYANNLRDAVKRTKPARGAVALMRIIDGDCEHLDGFRDWLGEDWALQTLAAAYPDLAIPLVDRWLRHGTPSTRYSGLDAARELPRDDAIARVRFALADSSLFVARRAREHLEALGQDATPSAPTLFDVLPNAPSETFLGRVQMVRTVQDLDALRDKLAPVLFGEAPNVEALVVLMMLFDYGDELERMLVSFGEVAVRAASLLVRAFPNGLHDGWAGVVRQAIETYGDDDPATLTLSDEGKTVLRSAIADAIHQEHWDGQGCLPLLHQIGADDRHADVLWKTIFAGDEYGRLYAGWALAKLASSESIRDALRTAWEARDAERFDRVCRLTHERVDDDIAALFESIIATAIMPADHAFVDCAVSSLVLAKRIGEAWVLAHANPDDPLFEIALSHVHFTTIHSNAIAARLRELHASADDAHVAAIAAKALVWHKAIAPKDLGPTLARASADDCAQVCADALLLGAPLKPLTTHVRRALEQSSETLASELVERLEQVRGGKNLLASVLRERKSDALELAIARALDLPSAAMTYWKD